MATQTSAPESSATKKRWVSPSTGITFIHIHRSCFKMGTEDGFDFKSPVHKVSVDEFYLGVFEATQEQWMKFMPNNHSKFIGSSQPVERISWNDAKSYIEENKSPWIFRLNIQTER